MYHTFRLKSIYYKCNFMLLVLIQKLVSIKSLHKIHFISLKTKKKNGANVVIIVFTLPQPNHQNFLALMSINMKCERLPKNVYYILSNINVFRYCFWRSPFPIAKAKQKKKNQANERGRRNEKLVHGLWLIYNIRPV